jgi:hypothetical protein
VECVVCKVQWLLQAFQPTWFDLAAFRRSVAFAHFLK